MKERGGIESEGSLVDDGEYRGSGLKIRRGCSTNYTSNLCA